MNRQTINAKELGAVGDGVADDTIYLQWALDRWVECGNSVLEIPPGDYRITAPLQAVFTANDASGKVVIGHGARIVGASVALVSRAVVRHVFVHGLTIEGGGLLLDGGREADAQFLYGFRLDGVKVSAFPEHGIELRGSVFEGVIDKCQARTNNTTGFGIYANNDGTGNVSSIDVWGCTTIGGKRGLYVKSPASDVKVYGGTFNEAQEQGILLENAQGQCVFNAHVENNWQSAPSIAEGLAGCTVAGNAYVCGVTGTTNAKQRHIVSVYATTKSPAVIIGGSGLGATVSYARLAGEPGAQVWMLGNQTVTQDQNVTLNRLGNGAAFGGKVGFFGAAPASRPTVAGSRADGTALASALQGLAALGLIADNTTA